MRLVPQRGGELPVSEDAFDGPLRVVEVPAHRAHPDVAAPLRGHLELLDLADLAFGVEDRDGGSGDVREAREGPSKSWAQKEYRAIIVPGMAPPQ